MTHRLRNIRTALIVAALGSTLAVAGGKHLHSSDGNYTWVDDNHALVMHARVDTHGVVVDSTRPTPLYGLRGGDVIVAVDGHAVDRLDVLLDAMQHHARAPATLDVRRTGGNVRLTLSDADVHAMFPPPPLPPTPPPPPAPPTAPTAPTPPTTHG